MALHSILWGKTYKANLLKLEKDSDLEENLEIIKYNSFSW